MNWFTRFLTSSIGQKLVMSLSGLFLMVFLLIHLLGNLQIISDDGGESFNRYAYFMTHNPLIKAVSYLLYASILLHAVQGLLLWRENRRAKGRGYAVKFARTSESASRNMAWIGIVLLVFIVLHMYQYWFQMHWGALDLIDYVGQSEPVKDLYSLVAASYENVYYVGFYVISMGVVGYHLWHGFWSAFQTLGLNHPKYTPLIKWVGMIYAVAVPALFALIPIWVYMH
jgi:succinate dehydrogenase / fumarate reductase cytochrome b subunit